MTEGRTKVRCAIYTRKSSEEGLEQEFNSLDAQREACEAYIASQKHEGWVLLKDHYDDGGLSGGNMVRPALLELLQAVDDGLVDQIVVYKVDRLTRSLPDFSRLIERLDKAQASFVSVTQSFNTATSMGRLTLNVLLSFAQFEREVTAERIRDKIAASKKKGMWMGGRIPIGYDVKDKHLLVRGDEAAIVRQIYDLYLIHGTVRETKAAVDAMGFRSREWTTKAGRERGGLPFTRGHLYRILTNPIYVGMVGHKGATYDGQHDGIVYPAIWQKVQDSLRTSVKRQFEPNKDATDAGRAAASSGAAAGADTAKTGGDGAGMAELSGREMAQSGNGIEAADARHTGYIALPSEPVPSPARQKRSYRTDASPLVGKLFDEAGDRLTPSHANKKGWRYRYYISNRLIARSGEREAGTTNNGGETGRGHSNQHATAPIGGWRLPAPALESAIVGAITHWLKGETLSTRLIENGSADEQISVLRKIAAFMETVSKSDIPIDELAPLIHRIELEPGILTIRIEAAGIAKVCFIELDRISPEALTITASFEQRKRGMETRLVLGHTPPQQDAVLIRNVAIAHSLYSKLKQGASFADLARQAQTSIPQVHRLMSLAFLSPKIVEAICTGQQPPDMSTQRLREMTIPSDWNEQHLLFGLT